MSLSDALFRPRTIALIGASSDASRLTARAQIYLRKHGFSGALYPVNPRAETVLGERAYPRLSDIGEKIDFAYVLTATEHVPGAIADCAAQKIPAACVLADGFADSGPDGAARQAELISVARAGGVRLLGPNSMGVVNVPLGMACSVNAVLEMEGLPRGHWSLVSQSGSVLGTLVSRAAARGLQSPS